MRGRDQGPGDIDAEGDPGESRVERGQVLAERDPRLVRQDFRSGWHVPENTGGMPDLNVIRLGRSIVWFA